MAFEELKARQAAAYSGSKFELLAATVGDIHDELVERLGVHAGERWLDLATGTGAVAIRAARKGASVTGQDAAAGLIDTARRLAAEEGLEIRFDVGDCEHLPYPDASFDVVTSAQGAVFAPDHRAVAGELKRVCAPGGRIALSAWRPGGEIASFFRVMAPFQPPPPEGAGVPLDWGRPEYVRGLLGDAFTLEFFDGESPQEAESPEAMWELFITAFGPIKALAESLDEDRRHELHDAFIEFYGRHCVEGGRVSAPREYVAIVGRRRAA
ncbi:MAG: class I SAM-dependent methyltransferase [Solirubrobacteraceae bacterium]